MRELLSRDHSKIENEIIELTSLSLRRKERIVPVEVITFNQLFDYPR